MTKIKKPVESKRDMELRHIEALARAYVTPYDSRAYMLAKDDYGIIRAAVYAVVPGKQKHKNIAALMESATKAAARRIRAIKGGE